MPPMLESKNKKFKIVMLRLERRILYNTILYYNEWGAKEISVKIYKLHKKNWIEMMG